MIDAVLSYQTNPLMGGVAAFNHQLAKRLNVPHERIGEPGETGEPVLGESAHPLLSVKFGEWSETAIKELAYECFHRRRQQFDLFLHDRLEHAYQFLRYPRRLIAANAERAEQIRQTLSDEFLVRIVARIGQPVGHGR